MSNELGTVASAARFGMNPTPLGAAGLVGGALLGGKGGKGVAWEPKFRLENGQYQYSDNRGVEWLPVPENLPTMPDAKSSLLGTVPLKTPIGSVGLPNNGRLYMEQGGPVVKNPVSYPQWFPQRQNQTKNAFNHFAQSNPGGTFGPAGSVRYQRPSNKYTA